MWITVVILGLAAAMMLGPIMMMQPTKRQRRLAQVREAAARRGMKVRMTTMPPGAVRAGESIAAYSLPWPDKKPLKPTWLLARQQFSHGLHFSDDWDWLGGEQPLPSWQSIIRRKLAELPNTVVAVEATSFSLGVYWLEQLGERHAEEVVNELAEWLEQLIAEVPNPRLLRQATGSEDVGAQGVTGDPEAQAVPLDSDERDN